MRVLIDAGPGGISDGRRCELGTGKQLLDGGHVFAPDGPRIGRISLP